MALAALLAAASTGCASTTGTAQASSSNAQDDRLVAPDLNSRREIEFQDVFSEIRLGVQQNDIGLVSESFEKGDNANVEILFQSPEDLLEILGSPRPHLGASVNTLGYTSQAYAGLTWSWDMIPDLVFLAFGLGGAIHNGELAPDFVDRKALGSRVLFREALELGARIGKHQSLSVMLDHVSNARLAHYNEGLDSFGIRYGFRF